MQETCVEQKPFPFSPPKLCPEAPESFARQSWGPTNFDILTGQTFVRTLSKNHSARAWPQRARTCPPRITKEEHPEMAKSQKRSNREIRKPKATKPKVVAALPASSKSPVSTLMQKPKGKH